MAGRWLSGLFVLGIVAGALSAADPGPAAAQAKGDPAAVIARAVQAMGGADRLAQTESFRYKAKLRFYMPGFIGFGRVTFASRGLQCYRKEMEVERNGQTRRWLVIVNGDHSCWKAPDQVYRDTDKARNLVSPYLDHLVTLLPLLRGEVKAAWGGEAEVEGHKAVVLKVSAVCYPTITLFFDRASGLLLKMDVPSQDERTGEELHEEIFFSNYQEARGVKYAARRMTRLRGVLVSDFEITEYIPGAVHDATAFAIPPAGAE
jgi:hypothetical protein